MKAFTDDKLNVTRMVISVFDRVENIVGKGEIACTSNFSFSHNAFKKASFPGPSKGVIMWEWVSLSETIILYSSKLKDFANDNFRFDENGRKFSEWVENTVENGEIAHYK